MYYHIQPPLHKKTYNDPEKKELAEFVSLLSGVLIDVFLFSIRTIQPRRLSVLVEWSDIRLDVNLDKLKQYPPQKGTSSRVQTAGVCK